MATYDDAFLYQLLSMPSSQYGAKHMKDGMPLDRGWAYMSLIPQDQEAYRQKYGWMGGAAPRGGLDGEGNWTGFGETAVQGDKYARQILQLLDAYGVNSTAELPDEVRAQLPYQGIYQGRGSMSLGEQFVDFITSPPVLLALGAGAGMYAGAGSAAGSTGAAEGGAAAGAAEGGAAAGGGTAAGSSAALGSGLSTSSTGASGLSTTAGGASGITATGANTAGTSLGSGYFSAEGVGGVASLASSQGGGAQGGSSGGSTVQQTPEQQTALQRILSGNGTTQDYITLFGQVAPSLLGMYASDKQADALAAQAARYEAMGAPYRDRLGELYSDPTAFLNSPEVKIPVQLGTDALARSLSTQGNPAGSGTALHALQDRASNMLFSRLGEEKDRLGGFGGLTAYNSAAPQAATNAIGAQRGYYDALGYGVGQVTNPPRTLEDILKQYNTTQGLA